MSQKRDLYLRPNRVLDLYQQELPELVWLARNTDDVDAFKERLLEALEKMMESSMADTYRPLMRLIRKDGQTIHELSTGQNLKISTISLLYEFLRGKAAEQMGTDFLLDVFHQFRRESVNGKPSSDSVRAMTERWDSGMDEKVRSIREENKERIIKVLVRRIGRGKFQQVHEWWNDFRFHLAMAARSPEEINDYLGGTLSEDTLATMHLAAQKGIPFFVTPYYLSLLDVSGKGYDDQALRSYILYSPELVDTFGEIRAWEKEDLIEEGKPNAAGWLLPDGSNIHRRYPEVAILIPDTMGRSCGGLCASCQRMYDFQRKRLNFNLENLRPSEKWDEKLQRLMKYFEEDSQIRDLLITGGDALMSQNKSLKKILDAVYQMAVRKREANLRRPDGKKYAELQRVRLGTRLPVYLPMRIDDELVEILHEFKEKAMTAGIRQFIIQTHFQTPLEVTPEAVEGIRKLLSSGWLMDNQLVYNVAASRRGHTTRLRQVLNRLGVVCYYTFTVKGFQENYAVFAPNCRSVQEQQEEKCFGNISKEDAEELTRLLENTSDPALCLKQFMQERHLPFLATDRNVLNLPGIGKSMSFQLVGITEDGRRILCFDHDPTRRHSPIIDDMGAVYIVENKSVAAYLRQMDGMGEDVEAYASIWNYTEGQTEPRFNLYTYPDFPFRTTDTLTNIAL